MKKFARFAVVSITFLASCFASGAEKPVETINYVDLNKYLGKWYEVASIPQSFQKQCVGNTTAEYSLAENHLISVVNSCDTKNGERKIGEGRAKIVDQKTNSKLKVTFVKFFGWTFAFGGKYWILDVDEDYSNALVGDPTREYAWILSRTPSLSMDVAISSERHFKAQGYDTCKILTSIQSGGFAKRIPLCELVKDVTH